MLGRPLRHRHRPAPTSTRPRALTSAPVEKVRPPASPLRRTPKFRARGCPARTSAATAPRWDRHRAGDPVGSDAPPRSHEVRPARGDRCGSGRTTRLCDRAGLILTATFACTWRSVLLGSGSKAARFCWTTRGKGMAHTFDEPEPDRHAENSEGQPVRDEDRGRVEREQAERLRAEIARLRAEAERHELQKLRELVVRKGPMLWDRQPPRAEHHDWMLAAEVPISVSRELGRWSVITNSARHMSGSMWWLALIVPAGVLLVALSLPGWWLVLVVPAVALASWLTFWILAGIFGGGGHLLRKALHAGEAERERVLHGHASRLHRAGLHRPLRWWRLRCQLCFGQPWDYRRNRPIRP
ncbi:hypothetical protein Actkin_04301 [Actinokineospora sp. UTMC 2448]|nr:hypothetical protein Actkin_04301 [Actinokineospora sp. UTMC 2448]